MAKISGARIRPGDVLELDCAGGVGILGYVGRHPQFGELVWVIPRVLANRPQPICETVSGDGYFQFFPATTALRQGLLRKIGFCEVSMRMVPQRWCNIVAQDADGYVSVWNVSNGVERTVRTELSSEERRLPVGEIFNLVYLREMIEAGWTPLQYHRT